MYIHTHTHHTYIQDIHAHQNLPDMWVIFMRLSFDTCTVLEALVDMENSCDSQDVHVLEGWAEVIELGKKLLFALIGTCVYVCMYVCM